MFDATYTVGILVLLTVAICLAGVFPEEHSRRTDQLILSSRYGRKPAYLAKILAGISFVTVYVLLTVFLMLIETYFLYGLEGFGAAFQLIMPTSSHVLSVGMSVVIAFAMLLFGAVLTGIFVMLLSELFRNSLGTLALTVGLIIFTMFVSDISEQYRVVSQAWSYLPCNFIAVWNIFDCRTVSLFGKVLAAWQAVPVLYLVIGGIFAVIGEKRYVKCQVSG